MASQEIPVENQQQQMEQYLSDSIEPVIENTNQSHGSPEEDSSFGVIPIRSVSSNHNGIRSHLSNNEIVNIAVPNSFSPRTMEDKYNQLAAWAISTKQTREAMNSLLHILRRDDNTLPKDYRTLCKTPKHHQIIDMGEGKYIHFGLLACLQKFLALNSVDRNTLEIDMNIDGVPIAKSSNSCLWAILGNVVGFNSILLIGVYFGSKKPDNINEYMHSFNTEYFTLCEDIETQNGIYSVRIRCVHFS